MKVAKSWFVCMAISVMSAGAAWAAGAPEPDPTSVARTALRQGIDGGDVAQLMKARANFQLQAMSNPKDVWALYYVGLADWWLVAMQSGKDEKKKDIERLCAEGLERCDKALALDPKNADAIALKGSLQGLMIGFHPDQAINLGPAAKGNFDQAKSIDASNPRVWVLSGINTLHMPAFFGGGAEPALKEFQRAQSLFTQAAAAAAYAPDWGKDDAFLWAGRAQMKLGDYEGAKASYQQALVANPNNGWVKHTLLPEAEKSLASAQEPAK